MRRVPSLHTYAAEGNVSGVKRLLKRVDPNEKDERRRTALHWAAQEGHLEVIQCLVAAHADVNAADGLGFTPLHIAAGEGESRIVEELLKAGASAKIRNPSDCSGTPLHLACAWDRMEVVKLLVESSDVEINARNSEGKTALDCALENEFIPIATYLVEHGATA